MERRNPNIILNVTQEFAGVPTPKGQKLKGYGRVEALITSSRHGQAKCRSYTFVRTYLGEDPTLNIPTEEINIWGENPTRNRFTLGVLVDTSSDNPHITVDYKPTKVVLKRLHAVQQMIQHSDNLFKDDASEIITGCLKTIYDFAFRK